MKYDIVHSRWYAGGPDCIGVVVIDSGRDGLKAYIGTAHGLSEEADLHHIAALGTKLEPEVSQAMFPSLAEKKWAER